MNPKQQARLGLFHLEEAILDVLSVEEPLEPSPISTRIGIRSLTDASLTLAYAICSRCPCKTQGGRTC